MWRLLLLLGRGRCAPTPARPACAPGLGRGRSPERAPAAQDGPEREGRRPLPGLVPRYSVREAVTWGAVGALLLQLLRQIAWLRSLPDRRTERRLPWRSSLPSQPAAVSDASSSCPSEQLGSQLLQNASPEAVAENSSSGIPSGQGESQPWAEAGAFQIPVSSRVGPVLPSAKGDPAQRGHLEEAAFQLQQIFRIDISIALNILGIESMRAGHCRVAFTCFKLAADRGYSKAQFNVGLCYEHGRGTEKDLEKAGFYYCQAASSHHPMAQYRYARFLLQHGAGSRDGHHRAVTLLEQAAEAGITEAQAYLGVFYMRGLQAQEKRGVKYLLQAANSGDAQSRFHLGVCYEQGLGVQQDLAAARRHYQQSAAAGNTQAQERLQAWEHELQDEHTKHPFPPGLRASSSSPDFWTVEPVCAGVHSRQGALPLPHSWSSDRLPVVLLSRAGWSRAFPASPVPLELQGWQPQHWWH